jgi:hypothetical protein
MLSISSIKIKQIYQGTSLALSAISLIALSLSPWIPFLISPAAKGLVANTTSNSLHRLCIISDLPVPGGPDNSMPFGKRSPSTYVVKILN